MPVVTVNKYLQNIFITSKNPPPTVFWLTSTETGQNHCHKRELKGRESCRELTGTSYPQEGGAPALQNRLHRQTLGHLSLQPSLWRQAIVVGGWWVEEIGEGSVGDGLGFPELSEMVHVRTRFVLFLSLNRNSSVRECEFMAPQQKRKRRRLMSRWRWMKRRGLGSTTTQRN